MTQSRRWAWCAGLAMMLACACGARAPVEHGGVLSTAPSLSLATTSETDVRVAWHDAGLHPIGQPVAIGGLAIAVVLEGEQLFLVALDATTGAVRWRRRTTPSAMSTYRAPAPLKLGEDKLAYFRPTRGDELHGYARLVIAEARTGRDLVVSGERRFVFPATVCNDGASVCMTVGDWDSDRRSLVRLDIATGHIGAVVDRFPRSVWLAHDAGLFELLRGEVETVAMVGRRGVLWYLRLRFAFPSGFTADHGATWQLHDGVFVGSVMGASTQSRGADTFDLQAASANVGIDRASGDVRWRNRGTKLCVHTDRAAVRCRARGTVTVYDSDRPSSYAGLDITVEGFDPRTGATTWSSHVGDVPSLAPGGAQPPVAGSTTIALPQPEGPLLLDYTTGATERASTDATFWCLADAHYEHAALRSSWQHGWTSYKNRGGDLAFVCAADGKPAARLPSAAATRAVGATLGDHTVIATHDGFYGFASPAPAPVVEPAGAAVTPGGR